MDEWNFKRVGIEDQKLIEEYFRKYPERSCDRTFFGVLLWGRHYNLKFADTGKALLFREEDERGYGFAWPAGSEEEIRELIDLSLKKLLHTRAEIERFLQEVEDPELRLIIRLRSINNLGWQEIGEELGMDRRTASRKYQRFCEEKLARNVPA